MHDQDSRRIAAALMRLGGEGAGVEQIAEVIVSILQDIDAALSPVIGNGGVAALYKRSLFLGAGAHPRLAGLHEGIPTVLDMAHLKSALELQSSADAASAGGALLQTFYELLASLVGPSLTDRLLRPTWAKFLADWPPKDNHL